MKTTPRFPRLRALVRALTSPRRVWFWTTTFPVLLAAVALFLVMRPGVGVQRSAKVGVVEVSIVRADDEDAGRVGAAGLHWPHGTVGASCVVPVAGRLAWRADPAIHGLGPVIWRWEPGHRGLGIDAHWFVLWTGMHHD